MIDDESLVKTRTNICLSDASAVPSYSVPSPESDSLRSFWTSPEKSLGPISLLWYGVAPEKSCTSPWESFNDRSK